MNEPIWSTITFDPYNYLGRQVMKDPHCSKGIFACRIGNNTEEFVTIRPRDEA